MGDEGVVGSSPTRLRRGRLLGVASGLRSHAAAKPCDSMPSATFERVEKFENADERRELDQAGRPERLEQAWPTARR